MNVFFLERIKMALDEEFSRLVGHLICQVGNLRDNLSYLILFRAAFCGNCLFLRINFFRCANLYFLLLFDFSSSLNIKMVRRQTVIIDNKVVRIDCFSIKAIQERR